MKKKFEIIPAIDLIDGKCVRLTQGDYAQKKIYNENPLEVAKAFEAIGITRLHLVDLDGAKSGKPVNMSVLNTIASGTKLRIDFGGGIKTNEDIQAVFSSGAQWATIGSIAVKNEALFAEWINKYGADKILLGADVKDEMIAISGWLEQTDISIYEFINRKMDLGIETLFCTDINKDGLLKGASVDLYEKVLKQFPQLNLIASGGVATIQDVLELIEIGCSGVIIGKAIYEGRINMKELEKLNNELC